MKTRILTLLVAASLASLAGFAAAPALAETVTYKAALSGAEEVPATMGKGMGMVDATYDTMSESPSWKGSYSGLSGPATAARFHGPADEGANAGVMLPVQAPTSPFEGSAALTEAQAADLAAGRRHFNVHTAADPNGEIRGQVTKAK